MLLQQQVVSLRDRLCVSDEPGLEDVQGRVGDSVGAETFVQDADLLDVLGLDQPGGHRDCNPVRDR